MIVDAEIGTVPLDLGQWECHLWEEDADDLGTPYGSFSFRIGFTHLHPSAKS